MTYTGRRTAPPEAAGRSRSAARSGAVGDGVGPVHASRGRDDRHPGGFPLHDQHEGLRYSGDGHSGNGYVGNGYADRPPAQGYGYPAQGYGYPGGDGHPPYERYGADDGYADRRAAPTDRPGRPQRAQGRELEPNRDSREVVPPAQDPRRPRGSRPSTGSGPVGNPRQARGPLVETWHVGESGYGEPRGLRAAQPRTGQIRQQGPVEDSRRHAGVPRGAGPVRTFTGEIRQIPDDGPRRPRDGAPRDAGAALPYADEIRPVLEPSSRAFRDADSRSRRDAEPRQSRRDAEPRQSRRDAEPRQSRRDAEPRQSRRDAEPRQSRQDAEPRQSRQDAEPRRSRPDTERRPTHGSGAAPLSRREARARETGQLRRAPDARSGLPDSGGMLLPAERTPGRGLPLTGSLQLSAPVQRIKALLSDWTADARQVLEERFDVDARTDVRTDARTGSRFGEAWPIEGRPQASEGPGERARTVGTRSSEDELPSRRRRDRAERADRADRRDRAVGGGTRRDRDIPASAPAHASGRGRSGDRTGSIDRGSIDRTGSIVLEGVRRLDAPQTGAVTHHEPGLRGGELRSRGDEDRTPGGRGRGRGPGSDGLRSWIERARRTERPEPEDEEDLDDGPENDHRRQLLTSVLALSGLGVTGWVASHMAGDGAGAATTPSTAPVTQQAAPVAAPAPVPVTTAGGRHTSVMLGNGEIDGQHERVLELVDELEDTMEAGQSRRRQALVLGDLVSWLKVHFAFEEALMDSYELADSTMHKTHHRAFLTQMTTFAKKFASGTADLTPDVIGMVRSWLKDHNSQDDLRLVNELSARGIPSAI
jgi:hemerythrin-like metal-binding protein